MIRKYFSNKINLVEGLIIMISLVWFLISKIFNQLGSPEIIINSTFLILLATLVIFRSSNIRHMHFAFLLLVLAILGDVFRFDQFVYAVSSLLLSLFILGVVNMLFFKNEDQRE